jgi:hypothetical protein
MIPGAGMLELDKDRTAFLVDGIYQSFVARDIHIIIQMELDRRMLDSQRIFHTAGLHNQESYSSCSQILIISYHPVADKSGRLDEGCPISCFDDPVSEL